MSPAESAVKPGILGIPGVIMVNATRTKRVCHDIWSLGRIGDSTTGGVAMKTHPRKIFDSLCGGAAGKN
jgi:hypothetical protein